MKKRKLPVVVFSVLSIVASNMTNAGDSSCYGLTSESNRFECGTHGNCTWYAAYKRPDLKGLISGNAGTWYNQAPGLGFWVGQKPMVGAIVEFSGHVAYTEFVHSDGSFDVTEMDYTGQMGNGKLYASYVPVQGGYRRRNSLGVLGGQIWTLKGFIYPRYCVYLSEGEGVFCWNGKDGYFASCDDGYDYALYRRTSPGNLATTNLSSSDGAKLCANLVSRDNVYSVDLGAYKGGNATEAAYGGLSIKPNYPIPGAKYGAGSSTPPTDSPKSGKPNFVGKSIRLYDISGVERYTFKKMDTIRMVGKLSNNGSANIPSDKDVNSMFLLSKGYNEDPHGDWQVVGRDETRSDNIEVGDTQQEEETLKLWERSDIAAGRVYNIVFCADRKERDNNNGGEFEEIHESDNCTSEAVFEVEGTYNFLANLAALSNNQPKPGESFSYTAGIGNTLDQPNEDVSVALYISPNQDWNGRWLVDSFTVPASSLPTGGSFWRNGTLIAPSSGEYMLWLCVNPHGTIPETTGSDNCKSQWFKVKSELNFSLSNLTITKQSFMPGERMPVTATSLVTGGSSTQGVDLSFFITPDTWENRRGIDVAIVPPLQDGVPFTENYAVAAPQTGSYRLYACLNASGLTPEANGNDNCQSVWFESKNSDIPNPPPSQTEEEEEFEAMQAWMLLMF